MGVFTSMRFRIIYAGFLIAVKTAFPTRASRPSWRILKRLPPIPVLHPTRFSTFIKIFTSACRTIWEPPNTTSPYKVQTTTSSEVCFSTVPWHLVSVTVPSTTVGESSSKKVVVSIPSLLNKGTCQTIPLLLVATQTGTSNQWFLVDSSFPNVLWPSKKKTLYGWCPPTIYVPKQRTCLSLTGKGLVTLSFRAVW